MDAKQTNTEQAILDAAEKVFLDKGYVGAKTTDIAKLAGVNHALLHYYFRSKENLFNVVFEKKADFLLNSFSEAFEQEKPFLEKLKLSIETHFDFIGEMPKLPMFIIREIISNKERKEFILSKIMPRGVTIFSRLEKAIEQEIEKGTICPVMASNLVLNIASLNVFAYISAQIFFEDDTDTENSKFRSFLEQRKRNNVELILKGLQP